MGLVTVICRETKRREVRKEEVRSHWEGFRLEVFLVGKSCLFYVSEQAGRQGRHRQARPPGFVCSRHIVHIRSFPTLAPEALVSGVVAAVAVGRLPAALRPGPPAWPNLLLASTGIFS